MTRHLTAIAESVTHFDDCLLSSCLRRLFRSKTEDTTDFSYSISNSLSGLKEALGALNQDHPVECSFQYLESLRLTLPDVAFRYAVVYKNHQPVLLAWFQMFTLTSRNFNPEKNKGFVKRILRFFIDLKGVRVLIAGNALRNNTPCLCFDSNVINHHEAAEILVSVAEKIGADENVAGLVIKDFSFTPTQQKWLAGMGFEKPWEDLEMILDIHPAWQSFAGYTNALSRKYKARALKIREAASTLHIKEITMAELPAQKAAMARLFAGVKEHQSFALTQPSEDHFMSMKNAYGDRFEILGFYSHDKLVAFTTALIGPKAYELYYVGFAYELNTQYQLYFNLLFTGVDRAISLGLPQLRLGRTSFDAKASLGAKPVELGYYFKAGNIPAVVSNWFANYFSSLEDGKWKQRNPLKECAGQQQQTVL